MKVLFVLCFVTFIGLSIASELMSAGGDYECEEGTHIYVMESFGCGYKTPEPTCDEPNPVPETNVICDFSACYCDYPTVRDPASNKCVSLEQCPAK